MVSAVKCGWRSLLLVALLAMGSAVQAGDKVDIASMQRQAEAGDAYAQLNLGAAYDNGIGVAKDVDKALQWYQKAAEQGVAEAQFNLAHLMVEQEISAVAAAEWMEKAANQGMADAQYLMGVIYFEGIGVEPDDGKAYSWLQKAERQGNEDARQFLKKHFQIGE